MKPSICRSVIFHGLAANGSLEHPAVITRAWSDADPATDESVTVLVNLHVFPDAAHDSLPQTSVRLFDSLEQAQAVLGDGWNNGRFCYWPPKV